MSFSALFIHRPIATVLLAAGILLLGILALTRLPIASLPAVERPTIMVESQLPGASADTIASSLAQPLERELGTIPGIIEMESFSAAGGTQITLQFDLSKDIDVAAGEVLAAINAASSNLPQNLPWPPYYRKVNPSGLAPVALALTSDVFPASAVYEYADSLLTQKISELPGIADVHISGAERSAVRVQVSPRDLANMNLSLEQVRTALSNATQNLPKGSISVDGQIYIIAANDQLVKAEEYQDVTIAFQNGSPVKLRDVAKVTDSVINTRLAGWFNAQRAVLIYVRKQPDANVVEVVDSVKALIPQLQRWLPPAIHVSLLYDRTTLIRASIVDVEWTIGIAIGLVILVIGLFLRRMSATIIPGLTIPVGLASTFIVMAIAGYSLDNLSLMAITISIGFIVDDAIIIVENVARRLGEGELPIEAAQNGAKQMGFTVMSITGALLGALLPILMMPDVVGRYFRELGLTLAAAIVASAIVSLTLTPVLCSRMLAPRRVVQPAAAESGGSPRATRIYLTTLGWALRHPALVVLVLLLTLASSAGMYLRLPKGFMPTQDIGILTVRTVTIPNISFAAMEQLQRTVANTILKNPAVESLSSWIGSDNGSALNTGNIYVSLKAIEQREPIQQVIASLRRQLSQIAGVRCFFTPWQDLMLGVQNSSARYQYTLKGSDPDQLWRWSEVMRRRMIDLPELTDVISSAERSGIEAGMTVDRARAAAYGVTLTAVDQTLYDAFGQRMVKVIYLPSTWSQVILEVDPALQTDPSVIDNIYLQGTGKSLVPLTGMMKPRRGHSAVWLRHSDQFASITLSFDLRPGVAIGDAIAAIRATEANAHLPSDIRADFRGEAANASDSGTKQMLLALGALFTVYVMLGILYESYVQPFTILTTLPSSLFGSLLFLTLTGTEFTLMAAIACILVVGIVMKNAIMLIDFAITAERRDGLSARNAILRAAQLRVRPILMTSLVAIASALPLALGVGAGHELRQPFGIASFGGLLTSQLLTLYTTPVMYLLMDRLRTRRATRQRLDTIPAR